jgi:hypothetical protein
MSNEILFNKVDIYNVIHGQTEAIKKRVQSIPGTFLVNASEHDLVQALVDDLRLNVPQIKNQDMYIARSGEAQVDVSRDPMRMIHDRSQSFYVPGNKAIIAVPFDGDAEFFNVQPQSFSLSPPRGQIVKNEIFITYVRTDQNAVAIKREYQATVTAIKGYLRCLPESAQQFNGQLENSVKTQLKARKDRLLADAGMTAAIGLPMKKREGQTLTYSVPVTRRVPKIEQIKTSGPFKPEPALSSEDYEEILRIVKYGACDGAESTRVFVDG